MEGLKTLIRMNCHHSVIVVPEVFGRILALQFEIGRWRESGCLKDASNGKFASQRFFALAVHEVDNRVLGMGLILMFNNHGDSLANWPT